jgi:hypothetical protein
MDEHAYSLSDQAITLLRNHQHDRLTEEMDDALVQLLQARRDEVTRLEKLVAVALQPK